MMKARTLLVAFVVVGLLGMPGLSLAQGRPAQGQDELWEVTTKMEMVGMPMAMPPQTNQVCRPAGKPQEEDAMPKDRECKMTDVRRSGYRTTYTMVCEGKDKFTGTGDITSDATGYRGTLKIVGTMDGRPMNMTQSFSGRRLGNCTYEDPKKKQEAMLGSQCDQALERMETYAFTMDGSPCKSRKPEFCSRVAKAAQDMREPAGYRAIVEKRQDWAQTLGACGLDGAAVTRTACQRSVATRDYGFTAQYCEGDARALAAQHCTGRDYTAVMSSELAPICQRYATRPAGPLLHGTAPPDGGTLRAAGRASPAGLRDGCTHGRSEGGAEGGGGRRGEAVPAVVSRRRG